MSRIAVLLSLKPEFASKIATGLKTIELRRRFPSVPVGAWIYFYVTLPVGAVTGRSKVAQVDVAPPLVIWRQYRTRTGLTRARFDEYFQGKKAGFAVSLTDYEALAPVHLSRLRIELEGFVAPQGYRFLDAADQKVILSGSMSMQTQISTENGTSSGPRPHNPDVSVQQPFTGQDIRRAAFGAAKPKRKSLLELKQSNPNDVRKRFARG